MNRRITLLGWIGLGLTIGCSSSSSSGPPMDVSGSYSGTSTNGVSSCPGTWDTGATVPIQFTVGQSGADVSFQAEGVNATIGFRAAFGFTSFGGTVNGSHIDATIIGTAPDARESCMFTWKGILAADLSGNTLNGTMTTTPDTKGSAECSSRGVTGCSREQSFSMVRPPKM